MIEVIKILIAVVASLPSFALTFFNSLSAISELVSTTISYLFG